MASKTLIFEVAWEVCNQIGGIYTVIKTKAPAMLRRWNSGYYLIGPYHQEHADIEFEETQPDPLIEQVLAALAEEGIECHHGRWLIEGRPQVILIDYRPRLARSADDKYFLWKDHGVGTPSDDSQLNDCVAFGFCVSQFFTALTQLELMKPVVAHFHEWMAAVAIPRIRQARLPMATIFTTHATLLGRYVASDDPNFYHHLQSIEPFGAARHYNIESRFLLERLAAQSSDYFTTISDVTAREAEQFLGRRPSFILPNGLNVERFTALHEFQNLHLQYKERIHEFVMGHFFPSYTFDVDRTVYFLLSGRYEYRNKGMDIFIEALHRLNQRMKETFDPPTVVAFIVTNARTQSINVNALQKHSMFEDLRNACEELQGSLSKKMLYATAAGHLPSYEELIPNHFQVRFKRLMHARRSKTLPPIVTHDVLNDWDDPVLSHLRHRHLFNAPTDPVKVIFHPQFLNATSPLFNLDYDAFVRGCHLGVFPSYYEPWGYTPLECLALGIPTVTTDLTGFASFADRAIPHVSENGIYILKRASKSADQVIEDLASYLYRFILLSRRERIDLRNRAERLSQNFDWAKLATYYHQVQEAAVEQARR